MAMMLDMPMSGWKACRYHMAAKSPVVQPTRHRKVLTPARRHADREDQKARVVRGGGGDIAAGSVCSAVPGGVAWHDFLQLVDCCRACTATGINCFRAALLGPHRHVGARVASRSISGFGEGAALDE